MVDWEPVTYKDLIILTDWMAEQGYSAARLAAAVRKPARVPEEAVLSEPTYIPSPPI